jgi:transcription initiation factor TFIID TATA-box-binding protein
VLGTEKVEATVKVVNVVASGRLGQIVNLNDVIKGFPNAEFPSKRFPGLVFRLKKPKTTSLIFRSGKIVCTGGRSENEAKEAVENVVKQLSKRGIIIPDRPEVKINNMVASANLHQTVDLTSACTLQGTIYEPDQFPAIIHQKNNPKVAFLIFSTGKLICTGAKNKEEIHLAIKELVQKLNTTEPSHLPPDRPNTNSQTKRTQKVYPSLSKLNEFTVSDNHGKPCIYANGLWCHNKSCNGPSCRFANLIQRRLTDGIYGCWGFHWQQELYNTETKKTQRKFDLN